MFKNSLKVMCCALGLGASSHAMAILSTDAPKPTQGFYIGGDLGYGFENSRLEETEYDYFSKTVYQSDWEFGTHGFGLGTQLGYQFNRNLAFELNNLNIIGPSNDLFDKTNEPPYDTNKANSLNYFGAAVKIILPLNQRARAIAKVGGGFIRFNTTSQWIDYIDGTLNTLTETHTFGAFQTALGFSYLINPTNEVDVTFSTLMSNSIYGDDGLSIVNFITFGYNYHFNS